MSPHICIACNTSAHDPTADTAIIIAAIIAAAAAILAALLAYLGNRQQQQIDTRAKQRQDTLQRELAASQGTLQRSLLQQQEMATIKAEKREQILRQMNELYGPLFMLRSESLQLRSRLGPESSVWRVVDHITELKGDPVRSRIMDEIVAINRKISDLLTGKAGLFEEFPPPQSFQDFLTHAGLLQSAWDRGENQGAERFPFPLNFDPDVRVALDRLQNALASIT